MGFMDKLKEAKQKATEILDQAAANRAQMQAIEEAANNPSLIAKVQDADTMGYIYGDSLEKPFDKNWQTVYGLKDTTVMIYHCKTVDDKHRSYVTEFTTEDIAEVALVRQKGRDYSFNVMLQNGVTYRLCTGWEKHIEGLYEEDDVKGNAMVAKEDLDHWMPFFRVIHLLLFYAKGEETRQCFNDILVESGAEPVFFPGTELDRAQAQIVCEALWLARNEEHKKAIAVCGALGVL